MNCSTIWRGAALVIVLSALGGCAKVGAVRLPPYPGRAIPFDVARVSMRDTYLDVELENDRRSLRLFLPDTDACQTVLAGQGSVAFVEDGPIGVVRRGAESCDAIGIGSLADWRDRRPRPTGVFSPRSQATFTLIYADMDLALVRGRFPLAGLVGWPGGLDTIAAIPRTEALHEAAAAFMTERGDDAVEFARHVLRCHAQRPRPMSMLARVSRRKMAS